MAEISGLSGWFRGVADVIVNDIYVVEVVNRYACVLQLVFLVVRAMQQVYNSARSMFGSPGNLLAIQRSYMDYILLGQQCVPILCMYGGMKEPSVYMHCCGLYLEVFTW